MHRDLLDVLRCPNDHDESWLIAMVHDAQGAALRSATLACPVCGSEFVVQDGVAHFGPSLAIENRTELPGPDALAAMLGVTEGTTPILLAGEFCDSGPSLNAIVDVPQVWLNAASNADTLPAAQLVAPQRAPLGAGTVAAAAIDATHAIGAMLDSLTRSVRAGGRIVAPASVTLPASTRELARDHAWQVAETTAPARGLITLRRRPPDV